LKSGLPAGRANLKNDAFYRRACARQNGLAIIAPVGLACEAGSSNGQSGSGVSRR
jgi:hypothetical protein